MLSDPGSATIKRYGIYNTITEESLGPNGDDPAVMADFQEYVSVTSPSERFVGIAYPGTFILDLQGVVTDRFFEDFYQERNTAASILVKLAWEAVPFMEPRSRIAKSRSRPIPVIR